jgi:hypothetical protein
MAKRHLIGLLLATEEDWPTAFDAVLGSGTSRSISARPRGTAS